MRDILGYQGKRVVITGAASGMGQAAARLLFELGAEVYALDIKEVTVPVKQYIQIDLMKKDSIDTAITKIPDSIHALFNCAALPGPPFSKLEVMLVNFVGTRYLTETLLPRINSGGAIATISSSGGAFWKNNLDNIKKLLAAASFEEARAWLETNPTVNNGYLFSKQCLIVYTKIRAAELAKKNIRINVLCPSPTDTPMMPFFQKAAGKQAIDAWLPPIGRYATPEEMAEPLVFLNSNMARFISGHNLFVDYAGIVASELGKGE
jgi:NAD(P)-dependent dehydrogenase (short-subunit alcohol dehydrogenase family)